MISTRDNRITCESSCINSYEKSLENGAKICVQCPAEISLIYSSGKCECLQKMYIPQQ